MSKRIEKLLADASEAAQAHDNKKAIARLIAAVRELADLDDPNELVSPEVVKAMWNANRGPLDPCKSLSANRKKAIRARIREYEPDSLDPNWWAGVFRALAESPFHRGENDSGWKADFTWILKAANFERFLEKVGRMPARPKPQAPSNGGLRGAQAELESLRPRQADGRVVDV